MSDRTYPCTPPERRSGSGVVIAALLGLPGLVSAVLLWLADAPIGLILLAYLLIPALSVATLYLAMTPPRVPADRRDWSAKHV